MAMPRKKMIFPLTKNGRQPCKNFFHDDGRNPFQLSAGSRPQVQGTGLVTANHSRGACTASTERYRKSSSTGKITAAGNRQHHGNLRHPVELIGRNHQNRACPLLLMTLRRVKSHQINITAPHQSSSLPVELEPVHTPSSPESGAEASHWANSSCRLYFFLTFGSITRRPDSTAMLTADPDSICNISRMAGGTASITEPPTFLKLLVYMVNLHELYFYITHNLQNSKPFGNTA